MVAATVAAGAGGPPLLAGLLVLPLLLPPPPYAAEGAGLAEKVIWAVNAGGEAHLDVHGIHFRKDPLEGRVGRGEPPLGQALAWTFFRRCARGQPVELPATRRGMATAWVAFNVTEYMGEKSFICRGSRRNLLPAGAGEACW